MHDPELLVLDEPTSGLDPLLQKEFADLLEESRRPRAHRVPLLPRPGRGPATRPPGRHHPARGDWWPATPSRRCAGESPRTIELTFRTAVDPAVFATVPGVARHLEPRLVGSAFRVDGDVGSPVRDRRALRDRRRQRRGGEPRRALPRLLRHPRGGGGCRCRLRSTRLDLRLRRRSALAYAVGVGAYALLIVALYPSFKNDTSLDELTESQPHAGRALRRGRVAHLAGRLDERQPLRQLRAAVRSPHDHRLRRGRRSPGRTKTAPSAASPACR